MSKTSNTQKTELSHTQDTANEADKANSSNGGKIGNGAYAIGQSDEKPIKGEELIHRETIDNTPYEIIGNKDNGYIIALGKYKLTEPRKTIEEAKEQLEIEKWNIIIRTIITINNEMKKMELGDFSD